MKKLIFVLASIFIFNIVIKANCGNGSDEYSSKIYWKAKGAFAEADFKKSLLLFNYLLDQNSDDPELNAYVGLCYKYLGREKLASHYMEKVKSDPSMFVRLLVEDMRLSISVGSSETL